MPLSFIIDDTSSAVTYYGLQWRSQTDPSTFQGTFKNITISGVGSPTMTIYFRGTAMAMYGHPSDNLQFNYQVDNKGDYQGAQTNFTKGTTSKTGVQIWSINGLDATTHYLNLKFLQGQAYLDYFVAAPDPSAPLAQTLLALDDSDSSIQYNGNWTESGAKTPVGIPFQGTQKGNSNVGDSFSLQFVGSSISVYGSLNQQPGNLTTEYSIDGGEPMPFVAFNGSQDPQPNSWLLHQKFFSQDVTAGRHNLTVNVKEVTGSQKFWFDYVLLEGSSGTTLNNNNGPTPSSGGKSSKTTLAIVLTIVGIALVVLLCLFRICRRRKPVNVKVYDSTPVVPVVPVMPILPAVSTYQQDYEREQRLRMELEMANLQRERGRTEQTRREREEYEAQRLRNEHLRLENEMIRMRAQDQSRLLERQTESDLEAQRIRREVDNLRRENEEIRTRQSAAQSTPRRGSHDVEEDAGPAGLPPPYDPTNYID